MALIIDDGAVASLISMPKAIDALRAAYRAFADGRVLEAPRSNLLLPNGFLRLMAAAWRDRGVIGYKEFHRVNGRVRYTYHLFHGESGEPLALLDANHLTALRTGACGGLAADLLAPPGASVLGVVGSGAEARSQIAAVRAVRDIERVQIFSRSAERRERLRDELAASGVAATAVAEPEEAVAGAHVVAVATNTAGTGAAFHGHWLREPGVHVNSIGSTLPSQRELEADVWASVDRVVIDAALLLEESGDAIAARAAGTLDEAKVALLGDVLTGAAAGRTSSDERTLYKSVGSAVQDLALALLAFELAQREGYPAPTIPDFNAVAVMDE